MHRNDRYKDIQLAQLRGFCLAARAGNFTTAAKELGLSAATVWEQVRALERKLQAPLLRRSGHAVQLTAEGRLLLELVQPSLGRLDSLERVFAARRAELPQTLNLVATHYLMSYLLVQPIQAFVAAQPAVRLNLLADPWSTEMLKRVERGEAELGVIDYSREEPRNPYLDYENLIELEFMLLTATQHPLARKKRVTLAEFIRYPIIRPPLGSYSRTALDRLLQHHDLEDQIHVVMENNTVDIIRKYVAAGTGVALLYVRPSGPQQAGVHERLFDASQQRMPVALVVRKGACLTEPAEHFRRMLKQSLTSGQQGSS
jgi:DNA-binding transcriptional LysR family regulator